MAIKKIATATNADRGQLTLAWLGRIGIAVLLYYASAKIRVPFYPVPMTLQTAAVFAVALAGGWRLGVSSFAAYLALGAAGLPIFAGTPELGIGWAYMSGPTGGYLAGMLLASGLVGLVGGRYGTLGRFAAMIGGVALIDGLGMLWLGHFVGSPARAFQLGVLPFLAGDFLKIALVGAAAALADNYRRDRKKA